MMVRRMVLCGREGEGRGGEEKRKVVLCGRGGEGRGGEGGEWGGDGMGGEGRCGVENGGDGRGGEVWCGEWRGEMVVRLPFNRWSTGIFSHLARPCWAYDHHQPIVLRGKHDAHTHTLEPD